MAFERIEDWTSRSRALLYEQFKDDEVLLTIVDAFSAQVQEIEDMWHAVALLLSIDPVTEDTDSALYFVGRGAQLDRIGVIVGQPRAGQDDTTYRLYLRVRIRANRSQGRGEDLYAVVSALFAGAGSYRIDPAPPAGLVFTLMGVTPSAAELAATVAFLVDAKKAGVRIWLEYSPVDDSEAFCMEGGAGLGFDLGAFAGAVLVT